MDTITYVGLDVHKATVCVVLAESGRGEPPRIVGDVLSAEIAEKQARSIKYQLTMPSCRWPKTSMTSTSPARRSTRRWSVIWRAAPFSPSSATPC
jgi:hypothetical protein